MISSLEVSLIPAEEIHREFSYRVKKEAYGEAITAIWGWDEEKQREYHAWDWQDNRPRIILYGDEPVGTVFIGDNKGYIRISQFCILPEYQDLGIGSRVLRQILRMADTAGQITRLACLPDNPARYLYECHGFETASSDDTFLYMERNPVCFPGKSSDA